MAPILIERVHTHVSGLPKDAVVNTFAFLTTSTPYVSAEALAASNSLNNFYAAVHAPSTKPISDYLSTTLSRTAFAVVHRVYDLTGHLDGSPHGSPRDSYAYTLPAGSLSLNLPSEVCAALTFHADYTGDAEFGPNDPITGNPTRPRARDRGRVYIGPLMTITGQEETLTRRYELNSQFMGVLNDAALFLKNEPGHAWAVWSRKNAVLEPVVGGWVDTAYDSQRRRGEAARARVNWGP